MASSSRLLAPLCRLPRLATSAARPPALSTPTRHLHSTPTLLRSLKIKRSSKSKEPPPLPNLVFSHSGSPSSSPPSQSPSDDPVPGAGGSFLHEAPRAHLVLSIDCAKNNTTVSLSERSRPLISQHPSFSLPPALEDPLYAPEEDLPESDDLDPSLRGKYAPTAGAQPGSAAYSAILASSLPQPLAPSAGQDPYSQLPSEAEHDALALLPPAQTRVLRSFSGGTVGFRGFHRASYEAGYQCTIRAFRLIEALMASHDVRLEVRLSGFGQGREAAISALQGQEGVIVRGTVRRLVDASRVKIGGVRGKKRRRIGHVANPLR